MSQNGDTPNSGNLYAGDSGRGDDNRSRGRQRRGNSGPPRPQNPNRGFQGNGGPQQGNFDQRRYPPQQPYYYPQQGYQGYPPPGQFPPQGPPPGYPQQQGFYPPPPYGYPQRGPDPRFVTQQENYQKATKKDKFACCKSCGGWLPRNQMLGINASIYRENQHSEKVRLRLCPRCHEGWAQDLFENEWDNDLRDRIELPKDAVMADEIEEEDEEEDEDEDEDE